MPSIDRPLTGPMMTFDLKEQISSLRQDEAYRRSGRAGRTLAKNGRFRLVLSAMANGVHVGTHQSESPMTLHVVEGALRFTVEGDEHHLRAGQVLYFGPGDAHDIRATEESALLITISATDADFHPEN
jgi:quercetin dioxygenase-like cupin family protein